MRVDKVCGWIKFWVASVCQSNNLHPIDMSIPISSVAEHWTVEVKVPGSNLARAVFSFFSLFSLF